MKIIQLDESARNEALNLAKEVIAASYDEKQTEALIAFLKERISRYECKGAYDDSLCGFIVYDESQAQIVLLIVKADDRKKGIGTMLVDEVRKEASARHYPRLKTNAPMNMKDFYEAYGFEAADAPKGEGDMQIVEMEYLLGREYIGKTVTVTVDRPYGSFHPHHPDVIYPLNYGYVDELISADGEFQDAYVYGPKEPVESFRGVVSGIIYHKDGPSRFIVTRAGEMIDRRAIMETVAFEEQYYDTRFVWKNELN